MARSTPMQQVVRIEQSDLTRAVAAVSPCGRVRQLQRRVVGDPLDASSTGVGSGVIYDAAGRRSPTATWYAASGTPTVRLADGRQFEGRT